MQLNFIRNQNNEFRGAKLLKFFTAAYLIFAASNALAVSDRCELIFTTGPQGKVKLAEPVKISELEEGLAVKKTTRLDEVAQKLRRMILEKGIIDTTKLRSEFKHYIEASITDKMVADLQKEFPPVYDISGKLISGLTSRDNVAKVKASKFESVVGSEKAATLLETNLMQAMLLPDVYSQHRDEIRSRLKSLFGKSADEILRQTEKLQAEAVAKTAGRERRTYTDTSSTSKFIYKSQLSREAFLESAKTFGLNFSEAEISPLSHIKYDDLSPTAKSYLIEKIVNLGADKDTAESFVADLVERSNDEGVIRYRKYRTGRENLDFAGIPSPASGLETRNTKIVDADFAKGVTWLEFKMKNSNGEAARQTVVNKPRFPLRDEQISILKDRARFVDDSDFARTKEIIKSEIKFTVEKLSQSGVKEATWNEREVESAIDFIRKLHLQGHSLEPVGRTVYMRDSYNLNLVDKVGKSQNVQITRDRHVWELDRKNGQMLQALPWVEKNRGWQFQFNARSGWYEHKNAEGKVEHAFHPRFPNVVYEINGNSRVQINAKLDPVEVVELKIPVAFIQLSKQDVAKLPQLQAIVNLRKMMIKETENLNARRKEVGLAAFKVDKGKRSTSRSDVGGGITLLVHPKSLPSGILEDELVAREFKFNPETGFWVNWSEGADLVYHPTYGVLRLIGDKHISAVPVFYREADSNY